MIKNPENSSEIIIVKRPSDDADLPNVWEIPAGSIKENETYEEAVVRNKKGKLGVLLKVGKLIGRGNCFWRC